MISFHKKELRWLTGVGILRKESPDGNYGNGAVPALGETAWRLLVQHSKRVKREMFFQAYAAL